MAEEKIVSDLGDEELQKEVDLEKKSDKVEVDDTTTKKEESKETVDKKEEEVDEVLDDKDYEVPMRKSVAQHIIARQSKTIEKLRTKDEKKIEVDVDKDDDKDLDIDARIDKRLKPIIDSVVSQADEGELGQLYSSEPEAKKFDKLIRKYMGHENYKGVPPSVIYHHLAFDMAKASGAKKKQVADVEAKQTKGGGRSIVGKGGNSKMPSAEEIDDMSDTELEELQHRVLKGDFKADE